MGQPSFFICVKLFNYYLYWVMRIGLDNPFNKWTFPTDLLIEWCLILYILTYLILWHDPNPTRHNRLTALTVTIPSPILTVFPSNSRWNGLGLTRSQRSHYPMTATPTTNAPRTLTIGHPIQSGPLSQGYAIGLAMRKRKKNEKPS